MKFVDEVSVSAISGRGGAGCVSFLREKYVPKGGPDGGDGGKGGDVIFKATRRLSTLLDLRYNRINKAKNGAPGAGRDRHGGDGGNLIVKVPVGTVISAPESGEVLADLITDGQTYLAAKGGRGGKGNAFFKSSTRQAPRFAQPGEDAEECDLKLELKLLADVGIIGFPNAGKSTLISKISAAKPKIADYPFTTLVPNLGLVRYKDQRSFVVADIPGLVEGAHEGTGLGIRFLKHVERTALLIHVVDFSEFSGRKPLEDFDIINRELENFSTDLAKSPQVVALNKIDLLAERKELAQVVKKIEKKGYPVFPISAISGEGVSDMLDKVAENYFRLREDEEE